MLKGSTQNLTTMFLFQKEFRKEAQILNYSLNPKSTLKEPWEVINCSSFLSGSFRAFKCCSSLGSWYINSLCSIWGSQGAFAGVAVGFFLALWLAVGSSLYPPTPQRMGVLPTSAEYCPSANATQNTTMLTAPSPTLTPTGPAENWWVKHASWKQAVFYVFYIFGHHCFIFLHLDVLR